MRRTRIKRWRKRTRIKTGRMMNLKRRRSRWRRMRRMERKVGEGINCLRRNEEDEEKTGVQRKESDAENYEIRLSRKRKKTFVLKRK